MMSEFSSNYLLSYICGRYNKWSPERQTQRQRCASNVAIRRYREKREAYVAAEAEAAAAEAKAAPPRSLFAIRPQSLLVRAPKGSEPKMHLKAQ